jgi:hypothetical protein
MSYQIIQICCVDCTEASINHESDTFDVIPNLTSSLYDVIAPVYPSRIHKKKKDAESSSLLLYDAVSTAKRLWRHITEALYLYRHRCEDPI